jgi:hypothetical protein
MSDDGKPGRTSDSSAPSTAPATAMSPGTSGDLGEPKSIASAIKDKWANLPAVEVELVHEVRVPPYVEQPWRMLEIWTQNRIYAIDATMHCIDVVDQATRESVPDHGLLGAKLVGGQHRDGDLMHLSHPFPRPGTEAVFEQMPTKKEASFSTSSTVTRVVLRLRHVTIGKGVAVPTWDEIAGTSSRQESSEDH